VVFGWRLSAQWMASSSPPIHERNQEMAEKPGITKVTEGNSETEIPNGSSTEKHVIKLSGIGDPERYFLRGKGDDGNVFLVPFGPPANSTGGTWNAPTNLVLRAGMSFI
jgi:hypothetical protein